VRQPAATFGALVTLAAVANATVVVSGQLQAATIAGPDLVVSVQGSHVIEIETP
jgi:hypothetical protein